MCVYVCDYGFHGYYICVCVCVCACVRVDVCLCVRVRVYVHVEEEGREAAAILCAALKSCPVLSSSKQQELGRAGVTLP